MISGIILAAGASARLGRPKQLLLLGGKPLLAHTLAHALESRLDEVVLVLGYAATEIAAALGAQGQRIVINPDYAAGQSTSLRAGLTAVNPAAEAVVFMVGDQPGIEPAAINAVIDAYRAGVGLIVRPAYGGQPGHPVLLARPFFAELAQVTGDQGARSVIERHPDEVIYLPVSDGPPPPDVDTEADYAALRASWPVTE